MSTEQYLSITTEGAPLAEGLTEEVNGIGDSNKQTKKIDRDRNTLINGNSLRVHSLPGGRFPAKFGCQPIKLELYPLAHTYPANYVRVHFSHLGVYKESRVVYRAIRVRVS